VTTTRILVVDDDLAFRESVAELLAQDGHLVATAEDAAAAVTALDRQRFDLLLLDLHMPGPDGITLTDLLRRRGERIPVLMVSGFSTVDAAVRALHHGVDDFLTKPVEPDDLCRRVADLLARRPRAPRQEDAGSETARIVGRSEVMREVLEAVHAVAPTTATVLVTGETGTGKELVARAIHAGSGRRGPFVAANCAALAPGVLESELFGHVRGAFTGAVHDRPGLFRSAQGGTIFLDEIGDVDPNAQRGLLRVLQEREVTPVGSARAVAVDVRVIAATNRDLRVQVEQGRFRDDLFYRLNVFPVHLPPLRDRREDIPALVEALLETLAASVPPVPTISPAALRLLQSHDWPGNVRELRAVLEASAIRSTGGPRIDVQHLPPSVRAPRPPQDRYRPAGVVDERTTITEALRAAGGVRARAADLLGMGRTTLWRKMKAYGLDPDAAP